LQVLRLAVDRDNARAALGQQPYGRGSDDAGSPGDDGDPAIQANSIRHKVRFLWCSGCPGFSWFDPRRARAVDGGDYFICGLG